MKITNVYIASSWRNPRYEWLLSKLRQDYPQIDFYDFRTVNSAFTWSELESEVSDSFTQDEWNVSHYLKAIHTERAYTAFQNDFAALRRSQLVILCNPCGESAHMEAAYARGMNVPIIDFYPYSGNNLSSKTYSLELMKLMFQHFANGYEQLRKVMDSIVYARK